MSSAINQAPSFAHDNKNRDIYGYSVGPATKLWAGSFAISCNGVYYPAGTFPAASYLSVPGAANGGITIFSSQANVKYAQVTGGNNKTFGVTYVNAGGIINIIVQLATDGGGASTTTAAQVVQGVLANGSASKIVTIAYTGTGAGLAAAIGLTDVPQTILAGQMFQDIDNAAGVSALTIPGGFSVRKGWLRVAGLSTSMPTAANIGTEVAFADDSTVKLSIGPFDITATLVDVYPDGSLFINVK